MATFTPANPLEIQLRALLTDKNTPVWDFYTPLAAAPLWVIVKHYPELDGSDLIAPPGQNPEMCTFSFPDGDCIGLYTSGDRAQEVFAKWGIPPQQFRIVSAPGYQLLKLLHKSESALWINCGLKECQYYLDPDLVDILLERTEPKYEKPPGTHLKLLSTTDAEKHLQPVREFLSRQPTVRAVWLLRQGERTYELMLLMDDPDDDSVLNQVKPMVKALMPVDMECEAGVMMADIENLRKLAKKKPPFYARADFLKP